MLRDRSPVNTACVAWYASLFPTLLSERTPEATPLAALRSLSAGSAQFQQGRAGQTRRPVRALWQVPERPLAPQADRNRAGALSRLADDVMVRQAT